MKNILLIVVALLSGIAGYGQDDVETSKKLTKLQAYEDSLIKIADVMLLKGSNGIERREACLQFVKTLVEALKVPGSYDYQFNSLRDSLISIQSPRDNKFRIFTWEVYLARGIYRHYGAIQMNNKKELILYPLNDYSDYIGEPEDTITSNNYWYGAYYYNIKMKRRWFKKYYYLFGWDMSGYNSSKKLVDVLYFKNDKVRFGAPLFVYKDEDIKKTRVIIEYKKDAGVTMNYYEDIEIASSKWRNKKKMIIFDHLVSLAAPFDERSMMVPDGSYEGFKYRFGRWIYVPKVFNWKSQGAKDIPTPETRHKYQ